jgi:hypothetical protein
MVQVLSLGIDGLAEVTTTTTQERQLLAKACLPGKRRLRSGGAAPGGTKSEEDSFPEQAEKEPKTASSSKYSIAAIKLAWNAYSNPSAM